MWVTGVQTCALPIWFKAKLCVQNMVQSMKKCTSFRKIKYCSEYHHVTNTRSNRNKLNFWEPPRHIWIIRKKCTEHKPYKSNNVRTQSLYGLQLKFYISWAKLFFKLFPGTKVAISAIIPPHTSKHACVQVREVVDLIQRWHQDPRNASIRIQRPQSILACTRSRCK